MNSDQAIGKPALLGRQRIVGYCVLLAVIGVPLWVVFGMQPLERVSKDPWEYGRLLRSMEKTLGAAIEFMPDHIKQGWMRFNAYTHIDGGFGPKGGSMCISVWVPKEELKAMRDLYASEYRQSDKHEQVWYNYPTVTWHSTFERPRFAAIGLDVVQDHVPVDDWDVFLIFRGGRDAGTDSSTAAFAISMKQSKLVYWASRHRAPFN